MAKKVIDVKKAAGNDESAIQEVVNNDQIIAEATKKVEDLQAALSAARSELRKLKGGKDRKESGPGVIATILTLVRDSGKSGITKDQMLDKLVEMFPDRAKEGMSKTINVQLPGRMNKEKGVNIKKTEKGAFYIT